MLDNFTITDTIALITAIIALSNLFLWYRRSIRQAKHNQTMEFVKEYQSPEMLEALYVLRIYYDSITSERDIKFLAKEMGLACQNSITKEAGILKEEKQDYTPDNANILLSNKEMLCKLRKAVRLLEFYYVKAAKVLRSGLAEGNFIEDVCIVYGLELYLNFTQRTAFYRPPYNHQFYHQIYKAISRPEYINTLAYFEFYINGPENTIYLFSWNELVKKSNLTDEQKDKVKIHEETKSMYKEFNLSRIDKYNFILNFIFQRTRDLKNRNVAKYFDITFRFLIRK